MRVRFGCVIKRQITTLIPSIKTLAGNIKNALIYNNDCWAAPVELSPTKRGRRGSTVRRKGVRREEGHMARFGLSLVAIGLSWGAGLSAFAE